MKPYKHLNKRAENTSTGCLGTLVEASRKEGSNVWDIGIKWDCEEIIDRHFDTANLWRYNRIVPDDYAPDHGRITDRLEALIDRLQGEPIPFRYRHSTEIHVGKDKISLRHSRRGIDYWINVSLWAGQGEYQTSGETVELATAEMVRKLSGALLAAH